MDSGEEQRGGSVPAYDSAIQLHFRSAGADLASSQKKTAYYLRRGSVAVIVTLPFLRSLACSLARSGGTEMKIYKELFGHLFGIFSR